MHLSEGRYENGAGFLVDAFGPGVTSAERDQWELACCELRPSSYDARLALARYRGRKGYRTKIIHRRIKADSVIVHVSVAVAWKRKEAQS